MKLGFVQPAAAPLRGGRRRTRLSIAGMLRHVALLLLVALSLFPIYFIIVNSLKNAEQFARDRIALPTTFQFSNYVAAWEAVSAPIINSTVIVTLSVLGILATASLAAYAFALLPIPGKRFLFFFIFILLLIPDFLILIPLYLQIKQLRIDSTYFGVVLPYIGLGQAFSIFVIKTFFESISKEILEAARIDGASNLRVYTSIALPLSLPVLTSVSIIMVVRFWNDYLLPQLILTQPLRTVTMALVAFQGNAQTHTAPDFGALMAAYALISVPLLILFSFLMRYYVEGLTSGSVKL